MPPTTTNDRLQRLGQANKEQSRYITRLERRLEEVEGELDACRRVLTDHRLDCLVPSSRNRLTLPALQRRVEALEQENRDLRRQIDRAVEEASQEPAQPKPVPNTQRILDWLEINPDRTPEQIAAGIGLDVKQIRTAISNLAGRLTVTKVLGQMPRLFRLKGAPPTKLARFPVAGIAWRLLQVCADNPMAATEITRSLSIDRAAVDRYIDVMLVRGWMRQCKPRMTGDKPRYQTTTRAQELLA